MKMLEWTTAKNTMRITTIIKVEEGQDRNLQNCLELGTSLPNIAFGNHIQDIDLLHHNRYYAIHNYKLTICFDIIQFALG